MIRYWPLLFIAIPLSEIFLFIEVGSRIGALNTVMIVLLTAFIGVNLLRYQGFNTLRRAQQQMAQGQMPAQEMLEGLVLAVGGALLITPGFLTDTLGLICLLPPTRRWLLRTLLARATVQMHSQFQATQTRHESAGQPASPHKGQTIEGDYRRED
jgi:UPF0716 protein FxsA